MSEVTTGVRSVFSLASVYSLAQRGIGATRTRDVLCKEYIQAEPGMRVLDIGSGTSDILDHLPRDVEYIGLEPSRQYASAAKDRFGPRATIINEGIDSFDDTPWRGRCDVVTAIGVMHHLSDGQVLSLLATAARLLRPGGRFLSIDPCLHHDQHRIARFLIERDRGQNVRSVDDLAELVGTIFDQVSTQLRTDLLRVPYSHAIVLAHQPLK